MMYYLSRVWEVGKVLNGRPGQGLSRRPALQVDHLPRGVLGLSGARFYTCELSGTATSIDSWVCKPEYGSEGCWTNLGPVYNLEVNA